MKRDGFQEYVVHDLLSGIPGIASRAMFGGYGIYKDGLMFSLIADGELFFKADAASKPVFEARGSRPFTYEAKGRAKPTVMSYWHVPEDVLEDAPLLREWVDLALSAARSAKQKK